MVATADSSSCYSFRTITSALIATGMSSVRQRSAWPNCQTLSAGIVDVSGSDSPEESRKVPSSASSRWTLLQARPAMKAQVQARIFSKIIHVCSSCGLCGQFFKDCRPLEVIFSNRAANTTDTNVSRWKARRPGRRKPVDRLLRQGATLALRVDVTARNPH
jgi:hypothetical protein